MSQEQELARNLGFLEVFTLGLGTMVGAGIFVLPSIAAANAGPASMISFLIGGLVSLLAALSLSELATGMPRAGGSYYYVNQALGSFFGSIVGWGMWAGLVFATAFYMLGFAYYLTFFSAAIHVAGAALAMAALLVVINYRGAEGASLLQNVLVVILVGIILLFVAVGLFEVDLETLKPFNPHGWGAVAATAGIVYVTFIGFEVIASSAEEVKNPSRNLPLSMIAAVALPTVLYMLVMLVATGVMPVNDLIASRIPVADVAELMVGRWGALLMVVGAVLATVSSANASILSAARVNFAMGRDRVISDWLNAVHPKHLTPYRSILVTGLIVLALIGLGVGLSILAEVASFTYLLTYLLVHVAVVVLRRADPDGYEPSFRIPSLLYPWVPLVGAVSCLVILTRMQPLVLAIGLGLVLLSVVWYFVYARHQAGPETLVGEAIAVPSETQRAAEGPYRVVVPLANPATQRALLRFAAAMATVRGEGRGEIVAVNILEVPMQTSLSQELALEEERLERQRELLEAARGPTESFGVRLRTRAILARDIGQTIVEVAREEQAAGIVMGWDGRPTRRQVAMGRKLDAVIEHAPCEVTLLKVAKPEIQEVVVLAGQGPHAQAAIRRGYELARAEVEAPLTLVNVQPEDPSQARRTDEEDDDGLPREPEARGYALLRQLAEEAGLEPEAYTPKVIVTDDVDAAILDVASGADTVVMGQTRAGLLERSLRETLPGKVARAATGNVAVISTGPTGPRSIRMAIEDRVRLWLEGEQARRD